MIVLELVIGSLFVLGIGAFSIGLPLLLWLLSTKKIAFDFLRPKGRIPSFPGYRFSGRFSPEEVDEGVKVFRDLWNKHIGGGKGFEKMFEYLDIIFTDKVIVYEYQGKDLLLNGITDSKRKIRVNDRSTRVLRDDAGEPIKIGKKKYASEPLPEEKIKISRTALGHELIHIALWWTVGNPDHNHDEPEPDCWLEIHNKIESEWHHTMKGKGF